MTLISKEAFVALDDANYEEVDVPGWGTVRVRSLSGAAFPPLAKRDRTHRAPATVYMRERSHFMSWLRWIL